MHATVRAALSATRRDMRSFVPILLGAFVAAGCAAEAQAPGAPGPAAPGWQRYTSASFGFSVDHPADVVLLPETGQPAAPSLHRARFMQKDVAAGAFADREIPELTIEVFARGQAASLQAWLEANGRLPAGAAIEPGPPLPGLETVAVRLRQALAPNEFVYVATKGRIYRLTAVSGTGKRMLASVQVRD